MVAFGYTLMTEQRGPRELVADAVVAEQAGFDFEVISATTFRGWMPRGTRRTPGPCSARWRRPPSASR
jgi:hypothetical protein